MKNEPDDYSIDDLKRDKTEPWDGIRNYQVRNMIRDEMRIGDNAFFYHSNCETPGIYGQMTICKEAYADHTAFDKKAKYYDEPYLRFKGTKYEQETFFVKDPNENILEIKTLTSNPE